MVGRTLDRYHLLEQVGQGGMAVVYRALDVPLDREVAVKVLHPHLAGHREARARLQREAQAVAKLRHDNILGIYASSSPDSPESYLVTEFIHGPTLKQFITEHPLSLPELGALIVTELAQALACAHAVNIIHRDVKPENVLIRQDGTIVLGDFGIAQIVDKERMTATGQLLGSPAYMAPEHIDGRPLDFRSDVFSLGVVLYQLVTGELPFRGRNPHETLKKISEGSFTPPEELQPLCGPRLSRAIRCCLEREPARRYAAAALREELLEALGESGLVDPRAELRAFFRDPAAWVEQARPRIGQALLAHGQKLRSEGRTAAALAAGGRARQLLPEDQQVAALIQSVAQRGRRKRMATGGLLFCLFALGSALGYRGWQQHATGRDWALHRRTPGPTAAPAVDPVPRAWPAAGPPSVSAAPPRPDPSEDRARVPQRAAPGRPGPGVAPTRPRPAPRPRVAPPLSPTAVPAPRRVVRLAPWPKAVQVSLNGRPLGAYGTDVVTVELPAGPAELLFENPACYSERVVIAADANPGDIRVRLRWKPALLLVRARPEADVVVEGRLGRSGQVLALPLRSDDGRAQVEVRVTAPGHRTATRSVEIRANQLSTVDVTLEPG